MWEVGERVLEETQASNKRAGEVNFARRPCNAQRQGPPLGRRVDTYTV